MNLFLLSKYRTYIMGIAMILVVVFHAVIDFGNPILNFIRSHGYLGVDIFLLVSGLGLYFSFSRNSSVKNFYRKRFLKIYPIYFISILSAAYIYKYSLLDTLLIMSTSAYWVACGEIFQWYIPALFIFYLVFPLYFYWFNKSPMYVTIIAIILGFILSFILPLRLYDFTTRIPIFYIGVWLGYLIYNKKVAKHFILYLIGAAVGLVIFYLNIKIFNVPQLSRLSLIIFIPVALVALARIMDIIKIEKYDFILLFFGNYSLTIFLFYDIVADYSIRIHNKLYEVTSLDLYPRNVSEIIVIGIACVLAFIIDKVVGILTDRLSLRYIKA